MCLVTFPPHPVEAGDCIRNNWSQWVFKQSAFLLNIASLSLQRTNCYVLFAGTNDVSAVKQDTILIIQAHGRSYQVLLKGIIRSSDDIIIHLQDMTCQLILSTRSPVQRVLVLTMQPLGYMSELCDSYANAEMLNIEELCRHHFT